MQFLYKGAQVIIIRHQVLKLLIAATVIQGLTLQHAIAEECTKPPVDEGIWANCVESGVAIAQKQGKYGLVDSRGNVVSDYQYDHISKFFDGLAIATKEGKWGYVDRSGKRIIPLEYDNAWAFKEGLARVFKNGKMGVINKSNELVVPIIYEVIAPFHDNLALVIKNNKVGYIDQHNKVLTTLDFENGRSFDNGFAFVQQSGKWGAIDTQGRLVVPYIYDEIEPLSSEETSVYKIEKDRMYGLMDKQTKVILPAKYKPFYLSYDDDLEKISNDEGEGAINSQGIVVEPIYDDVYIRGNIIIAELADKHGIFDNKGELIVPFEYDGYRSLEGSLGYLKQGDKVGLFNSNSKQITPIIFDKLNIVRDTNYKYIEAKIDDKYGFIDDQGNNIIEIKYERWKAYQLKDALKNNHKNNK